MQQLSVRDERDIEELIAEGNDPVATRLVYELLDLDQAQVQGRVQHLFKLGDRYMALGLIQEDGQQEEQALAPLLERRCRLALSFLTSSPERDEWAAAWYQEAESLYSAAICLITSSQQDASPRPFSSKDSYVAYSSRAVARAVRGGLLELAQADLTQALSFAHSADQQAEISYLRGLLLAQQGSFDSALVDFAYALDLIPGSQKYRDSLDRAALPH